MTSASPPDPRQAQLRTWYDQLTARIAAADKDIGRALSELDRQIHCERLADLKADRDLVNSYLEALEQNQPLPGPWPPAFTTPDPLAAPSPQILFKSGRCDFYRHISLPPNYIPRPELLAEVRERLIAGTGGLALTSAIQIKQADVLHGMGGIGKSVLARALCEDPEVQAAFPDGILWATLGQTPDLTGRLREWIETLGGIVGQTAPTLDQLRNTLAEALRDKACLLIVDDAWRKAHLAPFCAGGQRCRLLITTRDAALAEGLNSGVYPVPVMAPDQAVALLEEWAGVEVEAEVKAKIVRRLGCLPLAVRLAGAQLRGKDPAEWLASFDARRLKARRVETVDDSLEATFALSLDALVPADRRLYVALAIFKEDEATPVVAVGRLWSALDDRNSDAISELMVDLAARALLARSEGDDAITVHDLLRDLIATELGEAGRIAAHRALLDAYRQTRLGDGWHTAPDDGYLYDHLVYHLDQLTDHDRAAATGLADLFADQNWLHTRVSQSGFIYDGYLVDLSLAWSRAHAQANDQIAAGQEPLALAACLRYTLLRTSVNSLAASYMPELVARAIETDLWPASRALSILRQVPDPQHKVVLAIALLRLTRLSPSEREQATQEGLAAAQAIRGKWQCAWALGDLAPHLTGTLLQAALAVAEAIDLERARSWALAALAPRLPSALLQAGLAAALAIEDELCRVWALAGLAPQLTGATRDQALQVGLIATQTICDERERASALATLPRNTLTPAVAPRPVRASRTAV
jgi:hypothetical protein